MRISCHAIASGRVQGVGFRYFVLREATRRGIGGWVRNCEDDTVEMLLQGEEETVQQLLQLIREGTLWIQVDSLPVQRLDNGAVQDEREFSIRY